MPNTGTVVLAESNPAGTDPERNAEMSTGKTESKQDLPDQFVPAQSENQNEQSAENGKSEKEADSFVIPEDAVDSGTAGVRWYKDQNGIVYFEAGEMNQDDRWQTYPARIKEVRVIPNEKYDKLILPADSRQLFGCIDAERIETEKFDTSRVVNMSELFVGCTKLKSLDLSSFDTSNVTSMADMFGDCEQLKELDVSFLDTSKVTTMARMFSGCLNLTELDLSGFDTRLVTDTSSMFELCMRLTTLDLSSFDTASVANSDKMLFEAYSLEKINLSKDFF
ncbi:MAG: BspA family leucine-rich repeat surface protein, partial [Erysipelotrichaceae bacterium]|nr:BspA family leucine-rich repeat surface protein [Erysipelotrichaceae bacterium]